MSIHELQGRLHAAAVSGASRAPLPARATASTPVAPPAPPAPPRRHRARDSLGQGTVEYVGLILLIAVLIAGVVSASRSFSDTGIASAVIKKIKSAIEGVGTGK
jgi:hypothetical protein